MVIVWFAPSNNTWVWSIDRSNLLLVDVCIPRSTVIRHCWPQSNCLICSKQLINWVWSKDQSNLYVTIIDISLLTFGSIDQVSFTVDRSHIGWFAPSNDDWFWSKDHSKETESSYLGAGHVVRPHLRGNSNTRRRQGTRETWIGILLFSSRERWSLCSLQWTHSVLGQFASGWQEQCIKF